MAPRSYRLITDGRRRALFVWQGPTALFATLLVCFIAVSREQVDLTSFVVAGFVLVWVVSGLTAWRTRALTRREQVGLALLDLVAAALINTDGHDHLPSTVFLAALPVAWLAFEAGRVGVLVGAVSTVVVALAPLANDGRMPASRDEWLDITVGPLAMTGLAFLVEAVGSLLRSMQTRLVERDLDLTEQVSTLEAVLDAVNVGVIVLVPGRPPRRNEHARFISRSVGVPEEGPTVPAPHYWQADRTTPLAPEDQALVRAQGGEEFDDLLYWVGEPGHQRAYVASARKIRDASGAFQGSVMAGYDATELLDSIRVREDFVATVSHELRTPLTSVVGYLEVLEDDLGSRGALTPSTTRTIAVMRRNALTLENRIAQLLALDLDDGSVTPRLVDVGELTRVVVGRQRSAAAAGVAVDLDAPAVLRAWVDPGAFEQVVDQVVGNAVKFTPTGRIDVELTPRAGRSFAVTVRDTGFGMQAGEAAHACERFYRGGTAMQQAVPGIGIGLTIAEQLVAAHDGALTIESEHGSGTVVTVVFPDPGGRDAPTDARVSRTVRRHPLREGHTVP